MRRLMCCIAAHRRRQGVKKLFWNYNVWLLSQIEEDTMISQEIILTNPFEALDCYGRGFESRKEKLRLRRKQLGRANAVNTADIENNLVANTDRGPSRSIWSDCPITEFIENPFSGMYFFDDFLMSGEPSSATSHGTWGQWASWFSANNAYADATEEGGVLYLSGGTGSAHATTTLTSTTLPFRLIGPSTAYANAGGKLWFECRVATNSLTTGQYGLFIGLADNTSTTIQSGTNTVLASGEQTLGTTKNALGFVYSQAIANDFFFAYVPAAGAVVKPTGLTTLVTTVAGAAMKAYAASTIKGQGTGFVKLGFLYDPTPGNVPLYPGTATQLQTAATLYKPLMKFYVNGLQAGTFLASVDMQVATFPNNCTYAPVIQYVNTAGSGAVGCYIDWIRIAASNSF